MKLFEKESVVGIFRGFSEGGLEFHADLVLKYRSDFQNMPMHGQFVLIQLETEEEAVLGRVTSISSEGRLSSSAGEDYGLRAVSEERPIPEELRDQYLKYRVDIRVLGVVRIIGGKLLFAPSHRRLPHIGSKVAFLGDEVLREIAGHNVDGAQLGHFALGEYVYCADDKTSQRKEWMVARSPNVTPRFSATSLVSRRTFVFARAGFGKSNLIKLLLSNLYEKTPKTLKRGGKEVPVGTVIFDPDGEYFWPDDKNRPGLCDVTHLQDKLVVFTNKAAPSPYYGSFIAGGIKLDIRRLRPGDVVSIALSPEKQDQQNVRKLKSMNQGDWAKLVDVIYAQGNNADPATMNELLRLEDRQEAEMQAARANMTQIVKTLHDPNSQMLDILLQSLREGKICVVDVSQMRGGPALQLSGLVLKKIFDHNQEEFTKAAPATIPTIAIVEEAQSVLGGADSSGEGPYISWVKEGRKFDLGAILITQQPGSISSEILSQGDNWFVFHLLSSNDLTTLKRANAHFSDDLLSSLLNEPIEGNAIFWSSAGGKPYPISVRILSFEAQHKAFDPEYKKLGVKTYASDISKAFAATVKVALAEAPKATPAVEPKSPVHEGDEETGTVDQPVDVLGAYKASAIEKFKKNTVFLDELKRSGKTWMGVVKSLEDSLPEILGTERNSMAYNMVRETLDAVLGKDQWDSVKKEKVSGPGMTTWVVMKK